MPFCFNRFFCGLVRFGRVLAPKIWNRRGGKLRFRALHELLVSGLAEWMLMGSWVDRHLGALASEDIGYADE